MCCSSPSPLDTLETTFRLLAGGPQPLALDGPAVGLRAGRPSRSWTCGPWCFIQRPVSACNVPCSWSWSDGRGGIAGRGSLAWSVSCCRACRRPPQDAHRTARAAPLTSTPQCSPACSSSWTPQGCSARRSPSDCFGPRCDLPLPRPAPPTPGLACSSVLGLPSEPVPHRGGGGRDTPGLGELGLPAQGAARWRAPWRPAVALPRAGAPCAAGPTSRASHATTG